MASTSSPRPRILSGVQPSGKLHIGNYFGAMFFVEGRKDAVVSLLWAREDGYWKIVSWKIGVEARPMPRQESPPVETVTRIPADQSLVNAAKEFLESWFVRKDYDKAFSYLSEQSYACYNLVRDPEQPPATSATESAQRIRAGMERAGGQVGTIRRLDQIIASVEPFHPAVRVMDHPYARTFALTNIPKSLADAADCATRAKNAPFAGVTASDYDQAFGMNIRFRTATGEAPTLRALWAKDNGNWRITAFDVEVP